MKAFWIAAIAMAAGTSFAQASWKLATGHRAGSFHTQNIEQFAREVGTATGGQLGIEVHPSNTLVRLNDIPAAEERGWARSGAVLQESTRQLRAHGIKAEPTPADFEAEIRRLEEKFSREWVRSPGNEANRIFIPYYTR